MAGRIQRRTVGVCAVVISGLLAGCSAGGSTVPGNAASCVSPALTAAKGSVRAGSLVTVSGRWFVRECHDVIVNGQPVSPNAPLAAVTLVLKTHSGQVFTLTTVHPGNEGSFASEVRVPQAAGSGPASITSRDAVGNEPLGTDAKITIRS
jgi:hypothetical protein